MKRIISNINRKSILLLILAFLICFSSTLFAQPDNKIAEAKQSFDEGSRLENQETLADSKKALAKFQTAARLYRETDNKNLEGKALFEVGKIYIKLGQRDNAIKTLNIAFKIFESTNNKLYQAYTINTLGTVFSYLGNKKTAFKYYNYALRIFYELDRFMEAIPTINNVGSMYRDFGDSKNALFYFRLALPHVRLENDKSSEGMILLNIANVHFDSKNYAEVIKTVNQAIPLLQTSKNKEGEIRGLNLLAVTYIRTKQNAKSINYLNRALAINGSRFQSDEAVSLSYSMFAWKRLNNKPLATFFGKQAVNKYQELRKGIQGLSSETQKTFLKTIEETYRNLADLLISQGRFAQAEQVLQMLKEEEFFDFVKRDESEIKTLDKKVQLTEKEKELIKRYSALASKITQLGKEFENLNKRKRKLSRSNSDLEKNESNRYAELSRQLSDANAAFKLFIEKQLVQELGKNITKEIEYDRNLQAKLRKWGNGTVALYTVVTENRYRVILTTPTVQIDGKTEIKASDLNKKIFAYREALQNLETDPRPLGKELYDILLKPIEKDLQAAGAKTLVWSLDGTLRYIPLATLSPNGKSYLVEKYQNVIITPKTRDDISDVNAEWKALGVGVSEALSVINPANKLEQIEFDPLPATEKELKTIIRDESSQNEKGILSGKRFLDKDFTMRSFSDSLIAENESGNRKYTVVHIASHFRLGNNWSDSFLLLGDGKTLTLEEISNSPEITFGDVELVTLSACDTAFANNSNGKEVDSLAEAIQTKSGKAVLATLWAVADESTSLLMSEFYRSRKSNLSMTKAESMQNTQTAMINGKIKPSAEYIEKLDVYFNSLEKKGFVFDKNKPFAHPYFWSPFVLIGNWR